jgi:cytochrome c biogenesis protein CcmG/thiol:disulfide interchange protein DsbE
MLHRILIILIIIISSFVYSFYQRKTLESQLAPTAEAILANLPRGQFETLDGKTFNPHDLYQGPVALLVVHFWGTWCAPCEAELPELLGLIRRYNGQKVVFLIVAVNDEKIKVEKNLKKLAFPPGHEAYWLLDNKNVYREAYGTTRVPETYVFSSDKRTLRKYSGPQEWSKSMFFQTFDEFIQISTTKL